MKTTILVTKDEIKEMVLDFLGKKGIKVPKPNDLLPIMEDQDGICDKDADFVGYKYQYES